MLFALIVSELVPTGPFRIVPPPFWVELLPRRILPALSVVPSAYVFWPESVRVSFPSLKMPPLLTVPEKPTFESLAMVRTEPLRSVPPVKISAPV